MPSRPTDSRHSDDAHNPEHGTRWWWSRWRGMMLDGSPFATTPTNTTTTTTATTTQPFRAHSANTNPASVREIGRKIFDAFHCSAQLLIFCHFIASSFSSPSSLLSFLITCTRTQTHKYTENTEKTHTRDTRLSLSSHRWVGLFSNFPATCRPRAATPPHYGTWRRLTEARQRWQRNNGGGTGSTRLLLPMLIDDRASARVW